MSNEELAENVVHWQGVTKFDTRWEIINGDAAESLNQLEKERFSCAITSPPYYWQRDYSIDGQIGLEPTIDEYVKKIADTMDSLRRVLKKDATLFLNIGDTYYSAKGKPKGSDKKSPARRFGLRAVDARGLGVPRKTAIGVPWRVALEMIGRGWILRAPIIWQRQYSTPEPTAKDRPWRTYEFVFMFSRTQKYYFNRSELGGSEDIWTFPNRSKVNFTHSAYFPDELVQRCINIGCRPGGEVIDPFAGSGTTPRVSAYAGRSCVAIDLNLEYCAHMVNIMRELDPS